jgi:hypothetical protein
MGTSSNIGMYWLLLQDLTVEEKLSLIELLAKSIQKKSLVKKKRRRNSRNNTDWVQHFAGSWSDFPESAEDMIQLVESARTMSRNVEML